MEANKIRIIEFRKFQRCEYQRKYYDKNKNTITEKRICEECGGSYTAPNYFNHCKTKKHQKALSD
jgi:hypothetical protein